MSDLETLKAMLDRAGISYDEDANTYLDRIILRIKAYSYTINRYKIVTILDFSLDGNLMNIS